MSLRHFLASFTWLSSALFWRTFLLLAILVSASMTAWFLSYKLVERKPRAEQLAGKIAAMVTITRAALTYSAADKRHELLLDLADSEGIRIYLREESDLILAPEPNAFFNELSHLLRAKLGADTQFARSVNEEVGFWVSFTIESDQYWLILERDKLYGELGLQILGWASISLFFALIIAIFISRFINDPLARLSVAARTLALGGHPAPLPESGPKEIRETNLSFNRMVADLAQVEADRAVILAGISHDLRTPITRMQLEVEMAGFDETARSGMQSDLVQMDAIIQQFLDYAKPLNTGNMVRFDLSTLLRQSLDDF
ncbi:MAG: histidine kinase dimerization/phospho-acceptor domain-containing protein, partial [Undibacterium sp.]|nr:histidine kinase dimerization/phospho-acceptor domain-containing protein [Undibacterium sp.]